MASSDENSSLYLQHQVQKNAEEVQNYLRDLNNWEEEMKRKDEELRNDSKIVQNKVPPIRNKIKKPKISQEEKTKSKTERIKSYDYKSWENFDVDQACAEIDEKKSSSSDCDESEHQLDLLKKKQQAIVEKDRGNDFFKMTKYDKAIECYTNGMSCDPYNAILPANRAMALIKQKKYDEAEADCTLSLSLDQTYVKAYQRRATARIELDKLDEAKQDLKEVLKLEPSNKQVQIDFKKIEQKLLTFHNYKHDVNSKSSYQSLQEKSPNEEIPQIISSKSIYTPSCQSASLQASIDRPQKLPEVIPSNIVKPIYKPPHLRSKKALKRIEVEELENDEDYVTKVGKDSQYKALTKTNTPISSPDQEITFSLSTPTILIVPDHPKTEYQFQSTLKRLRHHPAQLFEYLKKVHPHTYPKLLQESMEFDVFSIILQYLHDHLMPKKEDIFLHLDYLSKVKRFNALVLFISKDDKQVLLELFNYIKQQPTCNEDSVQQLVTKYGL